MGWYNDIKCILAEEPESWMAYIYGQQLHNIPHLMRAKPRFQGVVFQLTWFFFHLIRNLRVRQRKLAESDVKFLVFAGSLNQRNSLERTIDSLRGRGETVVAIAPAGVIRRHSGTQQYLPFTYSLLDFCKALFLLVRRGPALYRELKKSHPITVSWHFAKFCTVYSYLCGFHRVLKKLEPQFVITANDHNAANRCMLAVAHHLGIKTLYLQHASVSKLFPALRVNYAFLDGECALDIYRQCEQNQPPKGRNVPLPMIFLTGQKKHLVRRGYGASRVIGVALNSLDDSVKAIEFVNSLADAGFEVRVRWHPGQAARDINKYVVTFGNHPRVTLSNPTTESVSDFMARIRWLVAGNSSIHLEAALAGVTPVYYEVTAPDHPDYYGYVKQGLSQPAESTVDIVGLINNANSNQGPNVDAVRHYSATYGTKWEGREGELVAECMKMIILGEAMPVEVIQINSDRSSR